ncbi:MAG: FHA domain-containing protein [Thermoanaerobaculia bacterium]
MPRLDFYSNFKLFVKIRLTGHGMLIGRGSDCDLQLTDEKISRQHARISESNGTFRIENLSPNGTRVNHAMVETPQTLAGGDRIYIEETIVVYQEDDAPPEEIAQKPTLINVSPVK